MISKWLPYSYGSNDFLSQKFGCLVKFRFFDQISIYSPNFDFLTKIYFCFIKNLFFLTKTSIFGQNLDFWPKFIFVSSKIYFLTKTSIFSSNCDFLTKLFSKNQNGRKFRYLPKTFYRNSKFSSQIWLLNYFLSRIWVTRPFTYRRKRTRRKATVAILAAWIFSAILWCPLIIFWPIYHEEGRTIPENDWRRFFMTDGIFVQKFGA